MKKMKAVKEIIQCTFRQSEDSFFKKIYFLKTFTLHYATKLLFGKPLCIIPEMNFDLHGTTINTRKNTIDFWAALENYEEEFTEHLLNEGQGTFIDVGAHIGRYTVLMGMKRWNVHAFEPITSTFNQLQKNVTLNHTNNNTQLYHIALGDKKDTMKMMFDNDSHGQASLVVPKSNSEQIKINTLDNIFNRKIEGKVILKIDVEGFEYKVLQGAQRFIQDNSPVISIEIWEPEKEETEKLLHELGYKPMFAEFWEKA